MSLSEMISFGPFAGRLDRGNRRQKTGIRSRKTVWSDESVSAENWKIAGWLHEHRINMSMSLMVVAKLSLDSGAPFFQTLDDMWNKLQALEEAQDPE